MCRKSRFSKQFPEFFGEKSRVRASGVSFTGPGSTFFGTKNGFHFLALPFVLNHPYQRKNYSLSLFCSREKPTTMILKETN